MKNPPMIAAVACLVCFTAFGSVSARTWRVNQAGTGDAPTIQAAVDSSSAGDTILVAPGTYTQSTIDVGARPGLTIVSEAGAEATALRSASLYIMDLGGTYQVTVRGFLFENCANGLLFNMTHDCSIEESIFRHLTGRAMYGEQTSAIQISNNLIYSNGQGIALGNQSHDITLTRNTIAHHAGGEGFFCDGAGLYMYCNIVAFNGFGVDAFCNVYRCNDVFGNGTNYLMNPTGTNGNISLDPLFCGVSPGLSGNYYLQGSSPCAPGNVPAECSCEAIGRNPVSCIVSIQKKSWGSIKEMYR